MTIPGESRKTAEGTSTVRQDSCEILRQNGPVLDETLESKFTNEHRRGNPYWNKENLSG